MANPLEWSDLQYFVAVCERGSIGGAAQSLGVNHSTVLRRIANLERTLDVRLFDRLPRGYALTAHGQELAGNVAGVQEQLDAAQRRVTGADLALRGVIRVTAPDTLIQPLLLPLLAEFRRAHPGVQLELVGNNQFLNLTQREADVAVRGATKPPDNLIGRRVGRLQTALHAARGYLDSLDDAKDEAQWQWVGHDAAIAHLQSAKWMLANVAPARIAIRVSSLVAMADAVAAGLGVGWVLCPLAETRVDLVRLRPPPEELDTPLWVLTHPDLRRVTRIRALTDFLHERLANDARLAH